MSSRARQRPTGRLQPNLTSLIDVVFLLIVFFMLATQLAREQRVDMKLPALDERQSNDLPNGTRAIINVVPAAQIKEPGGGAYMFNGRTYAENEQGIAALADSLKAAYAHQPELHVLLRAARNEAYSRVHPAMQAVTLAGVPRVELATVPPEDELKRATAR